MVRLSLCLALLFACLSVTVFAENEEPETPRVYCQRKYPVDDGIIDEMLANIYIPYERNATCWYGCAMERINLVKDKQINWDLVTELMKEKWYSPEKKKSVDKVVEVCRELVKGENYNDLCDLAYNFAMCKKVYGDKEGLPHVNVGSPA